MNPGSPVGTRGIFLLAALVIILGGMKYAQPLLVPFLLAIFIAMVCAAPLLWLQRRGLPRPVAALLVLLVILLLWGGLLALIGTSASDFTRALPGYQEQVREQAAHLFDALARHGIDLRVPEASDALDPGAAMQLVSRLLTGLGNLLGNSVLIILTVVFILLEAASFPAKLRAAFGDVTGGLARYRRFSDSLMHYLAYKTLISLATGVLIGAMLWLLEVDYALLWGVLAFLLNFIPNIGSIIAAVPAVLLALIQFGWVTALGVAAWYLLVNFVMGSLLEPRLLGRRLGLSTLVVFLSLVLWGWLLGPAGMLLSVPLTMTFKIALDGTREGRWLAILLGPEISEHEVPENPERS